MTVSASEKTPASSPPVFQTDLAQTPLPEILVTIHRYRVPGTIGCRRGNEQKEIFVEDGKIIFATSNQIADSLGDRLLRDGRITQEAYDESVKLLLETGKRQGTILTEMSVLTTEELVAALRNQIQEIAWSVFAWDSGRIAFTPGKPKHGEFVKTDIAIPQAIVEGVRRVPDTKMLLARVGSRTTVVVPTQTVVAGLRLDEDEQHLLDTCDGKRPLVELLGIPPLSPGMNARVLYALFALQLIAPKTVEPIKVQLKTAGRPHGTE